MIDLEGIAHKLTVALYENSELNELEKAKIEYGLSLTLGICITIALALILAVFLRTIPHTLILLGSALSLRIFSGGAHCTSFSRCLFLSLVVFVPAAVLVKFLSGALPTDILTVSYLGLVLLVLIFMLLKSVKLAILVLVVNGIAGVVCYICRGEFQPWPMFTVGTGLFIQAAMLSKPGQWLVDKFDSMLKSVEA